MKHCWSIVVRLNLLHDNEYKDSVLVFLQIIKKKKTTLFYATYSLILDLEDISLDQSWLSKCWKLQNKIDVCLTVEKLIRYAVHVY